MSRKHFQALATALYEATDLAKTTTKHLTQQEFASVIMGYAVSKVADVLAAESPAFNRALFIEACETGRCKGMRGGR